ncbi:Os08g0285350 [Oryza sativa Japonica Group]|jgi:hypothetical protein|uniref:Os08g0285350 protein n=3 Tax=Oryza TaxID=4527 RepID=A3BRJ1_ORYSJ|nr:hypothetical protein OsJ_26743 [Oryza sativa Japonica Group]BAT04724.1 Os08g0285350 [Oryza sativa Japonica Group]
MTMPSRRKRHPQASISSPETLKMLHLQTLVALPGRLLMVIVAELARQTAPTLPQQSISTVNHIAVPPETTSHTGTQLQQTYGAADDQRGRTLETNSACHPYRTKELPSIDWK